MMPSKLFEEKFHIPTDSEAYQYDDIYRLIDFRVGQLVDSTVPVPSTQTDWNLDCLGNWLNKTTDGVPENRTHNVVNEITAIDAVPIYHDDNGNLQEDENYTYEYDEENRLIRVTRIADSQVVGEYQYDALSRRVVKLIDPGGMDISTHYFYDDARVLEEQDAFGVTQATYVYGNYIDEVMTMDRGGQTYYYHQNSLWSVAAVTDSATNVVERYAYDAYGCVTITDGSGIPVPDNPWGTPHSAIGNPYMFTGRRLDEETGLYYYRARYYDCVKGRFLQRDPLGYVDGMNLYEYVGNNPISVVDPWGKSTYEIDAPFANIPEHFRFGGYTGAYKYAILYQPKTIPRKCEYEKVPKTECASCYKIWCWKKYKGLKVSIDSEDIVLPDWKRYDKATRNQKAECDRFFRALRTHEEGHRGVAHKTARTINAPAELTSKSKKECCDPMKEASQDLLKKWRDEKARINRIIEEAQDAYERRTQHGATQGAVLDTSIR